MPALSGASMTAREITGRIDNALRVWPPRVTAAALAFEARWTRNALRRVAPDLADRLDLQTRLYQEAVEDGTAEQIETHGGGMCRGYAMCAAAMQTAGAADDAYLIGSDGGVTVAIGDARAAVDRVKEKFGGDVVFITPDEVAALLAKLPAVIDVKRVFSGAEISDIRTSTREWSYDDPVATR
ncbi:hypothetical protein I6F35_02910 [Bradyrhizobium sp. BRP22]|uniref:hypothetical protein n=1 Tax=Bradyrhizobium sp. BRP22 TaxID=2793821 RepID=UPI001CD7AB98|nr:hypothetical protein [Bradyrhizobium sp. BRP22]MCA1452165.1 hypothetical protein [Bradyrhizobium sp. BRP22]